MVIQKLALGDRDDLGALGRRHGGPVQLELDVVQEEGPDVVVVTVVMQGALHRRFGAHPRRQRRRNSAIEELHDGLLLLLVENAVLDELIQRLLQFLPNDGGAVMMEHSCHVQRSATACSRLPVPGAYDTARLHLDANGKTAQHQLASVGVSSVGSAMPGMYSGQPQIYSKNNMPKYEHFDENNWNSVVVISIDQDLEIQSTDSNFIIQDAYCPRANSR